MVFDDLGKWYQYWEKISMEIRSYFYNQEDNMINLKSLMNVFGKRSYLQGIFTYNILLKRAFLRKFSDRDEKFLIFPCVAKHLVDSIFPILSSTSLSPLKCIYWFFLVLSKIFSNDYVVHRLDLQYTVNKAVNIH